MNTIIVADDHIFTLMGTVSFLKSLGFDVCGYSENGFTAQNLISVKNPDIAVLDISMPGLNGLDLLKQLKQQKSETKVVFLTMHKEVSLFNMAMKLGACGYVLKEHASNELKKCIETVLLGDTYVSEQLRQELVQDSVSGNDLLKGLSFTERKIVELIAQQKTTKQIAELLFVSIKTIEGHRTSIIEKLQLPKEKNALMKWAIANIS